MDDGKRRNIFRSIFLFPPFPSPRDKRSERGKTCYRARSESLVIRSFTACKILSREMSGAPHRFEITNLMLVRGISLVPVAVLFSRAKLNRVSDSHVSFGCRVLLRILSSLDNTFPCLLSFFDFFSYFWPDSPKTVFLGAFFSPRLLYLAGRRKYVFI